MSSFSVHLTLRISFMPSAINVAMCVYTDHSTLWLLFDYLFCLSWSLSYRNFMFFPSILKSWNFIGRRLAFLLSNLLEIWGTWRELNNFKNPVSSILFSYISAICYLLNPTNDFSNPTTLKVKISISFWEHCGRTSGICEWRTQHREHTSSQDTGHSSSDLIEASTTHPLPKTRVLSVLSSLLIRNEIPIDFLLLLLPHSIESIEAFQFEACNVCSRVYL